MRLSFVFLPLCASLAAGQATPIPGSPRPTLPFPEPTGPILPRPLYPPGIQTINDFALADLDRDGHPDMLAAGLNVDAAGQSSGIVGVLLGDGHGGFGSPGHTSVGSNVVSVAIADLDRDGILDLAVVASVAGSNTLAILIGDGSGDFQAPAFLPHAGLGFLLAEDVNRDGKADLVALGNVGQDVVVLLGDGAGGIASVSTTSFTPFLGRFTLTDLNGDAWLDYVGTRFSFPGPASLLVLLGRAGVSFDPPIEMPLTGLPVASPAAGDLDRDGDIDLVVIDGPGSITILEGDGAGGLVVAGTFLENAYDLALEDLDADGLEDLALIGTELSVRRGDGAGGFLAPERHVGSEAGGVFMAVADLDRDGAADVVTEAGTVFLGDGSGGFPEVPTFPLPSGPSSFTSGDFDADGAPDLAVAHIYDAAGAVTNLVSVLRAAGPGSFDPAQALTVGRAPQEIVTADVDGDGDLDLATANDDSNSFSVRSGDGAGGFPTHQQFSVVRDPLGLALGDLNADGRLDVVVASANSGGASYRISVRLGAATGAFGALSSFSAPNYPWGVALGDLDEDGRLDLVTSGSLADGTAVHLGDGAGGFGSAQVHPLGTGAGSLCVRVEDIDGDGHLDILANAGPVALLRGDGSGALAPVEHLPLAAVATANAIATGDLDQDGARDVVTAVGWLPGEGAAGFRPVQRFTPGGASLLGDFTGDGRPDVVALTHILGGAEGIALHTNLRRRARGVLAYGTGTPGCQGTLRLGASGPPRLGDASFAFTCSGAPPLASGLLLVSTGQDVLGSDSLGLGALLHVEAVLAPVLTVPMTSDAAGLGRAPAPIPANPGALGRVFYAQALWREPRANACSSSQRRVVSSTGLAVVVLP
jgi:hypothetical protein